jgi:anti-sigma factor RsiW
MNTSDREFGDASAASLPDDNSRLANHADQLLISYLDGELDERASAELESRLASDQTLRMRLHEFQQTWDMLDEVEPAQKGESFVRTTIEVVVSEARTRARQRKRILQRTVAGLTFFLIPLVMGFFWMRSWQHRPEQEFVADLMFWENMELYDQVDSIRLMEEIRNAGWFSGEMSNER